MDVKNVCDALERVAAGWPESEGGDDPSFPAVVAVNVIRDVAGVDMATARELYNNPHIRAVAIAGARRDLFREISERYPELCPLCATRLPRPRASGVRQPLYFCSGDGRCYCNGGVCPNACPRCGAVWPEKKK